MDLAVVWVTWLLVLVDEGARHREVAAVDLALALALVLRGGLLDLGGGSQLKFNCPPQAGRTDNRHCELIRGGGASCALNWSWFGRGSGASGALDLLGLVGVHNLLVRVDASPGGSGCRMAAPRPSQCS